MKIPNSMREPLASARQTPLRVGIPIIGGKNWLGGVSYVELLARSQSLLGYSGGLQLFLIVKPETLENLELHASILGAFEKILFWLPQGFPFPKITADGKAVICHSIEDVYRHIDVYFPLPWDAWPGLCAASWIPDFQHRFLPEYFSAEERLSRDRDIGKVANKSPFIVLSSQTAERHFRHFYPESKAVTKVLSFYNLVEESVFQSDSSAIRVKYGVPERYIMCSNQFWIHKDHGSLFKALVICRDQGLNLNLVCTGAMEDYRHPTYIDGLRRLLVDLQLTESVRLLGTIPRRDQLQLMRGALATVQPSLFEGWSTVVEDGRALGKIQILSDLEVHLEQSPPGAHFFKAGDVNALVAAMLKTLPNRAPGPNLQEEALARQNAASHMASFGAKLESILKECWQLSRGIETVSPAQSPMGSRSNERPLLEVLQEAMQLFQQGRETEAETVLTQASLRKDASPRLFNDLGVIRLALNRRSESLQAFAKALLMDIEYPKAFENLWETLLISLESRQALSQKENGNS